jgi:hypothetical protein
MYQLYKLYVIITRYLVELAIIITDVRLYSHTAGDFVQLAMSIAANIHLNLKCYKCRSTTDRSANTQPNQS